MERNSSSSWLPPWTKLEHQARYDFAAQFVPGKKVVDCACGSGIGSRLFAQTATEVYAVDSSSDAVSEAIASVQISNLHVSQGDATHLDLPDNFADCFISLETIEHLQNDAALIEEAYRVLKPGGLFICSTPNREITNPGTSIHEKPWNPFHVREYDPTEFRAALERRLEIVGIHGQNPSSRARVKVGKQFASIVGTAFVVKLNKLLKCRWFLLPSPAHHAVRPAEARLDYEFYILIGQVPATKS